MTLLAGAAGAATVDPYFAVQGQPDGIYKILVQDDGKILVVGRIGNFGPNGHTGITRLNRDGTPDVLFNPTGGGATLYPSQGGVFEILKGHDGNILLAGNFSAYNGTACRGLVKITSDGTMMNIFLGHGLNGISDNYLGWLTGLATLPNNSVYAIVTIPSTFDENNTGSILTGFGSGGIGGPLINGSNSLSDDSYYRIGGQLKPIYAGEVGFFTGPLFIQPFDDKIVVGMAIRNTNILLRLNQDVTVDTSFIRPEFPEGVKKILGHTVGRFLVSYGQKLVRLNSNGSLDTSFNAPDGPLLNEFSVLPNNQIIAATPNGIIRLNENGSLDSTFQVSGLSPGLSGTVTLAPDGTIYVIATAIGGQLIRLIPDFAPIIVQGPQSGVGTIGTGFNFPAITVYGTEAISYQWTFNNVSVPEATNAHLNLGSMDASRVGAYAVVVSNPLGSVTSAPAYVVLPGLATLFQSPQSLTVTNGSTAAFGVAAFGQGTLAYQWQLNGTNLSGATNATLTLTNAAPAQAGSYSVAVSNPAGTTNSAPALLTVLVPPQITVPPPASVTNGFGTTAQFGVTATGTAPLAYQWFHGSTPALNGTGSSLLLPNVQLTQAGNYQVVITNAAGAVTSSVVSLTVTVQPPSLLSQPAGQSFTLGSGLTLSVTAGGHRAALLPVAVQRDESHG